MPSTIAAAQKVTLEKKKYTQTGGRAGTKQRLSCGKCNAKAFTMETGLSFYWKCSAGSQKIFGFSCKCEKGATHVAPLVRNGFLGM